MEPLISVIVPIFNVEQYLSQCIDSIINQTYRNLEIILVDDGSSDSCGAICDEYARQDGRIKVIHKENGGVSSARNAGLDAVRGEYIGFVDPGDWIVPDMYEYMYQKLCGYKADIVTCGYINVHDTWMDYRRSQTDEVYIREKALDELFWDYKIRYFLWDKLYKAELWSGIQFPIGRIFEDRLTVYKVFERADRIALLREAKYYYRIRPDGLTNTGAFLNRRSIYSAVIDLYQAVVPRMPRYKIVLHHDIRNWCIDEICREIAEKPERLESNMRLVSILAPFVNSCMEDLVQELKPAEWERKKWAAFAEGTAEGCRRAHRYHRKQDRAWIRKEKIKKLLRL